MYVLTSVSDSTILAALIATPGILFGSKVSLFVSDIVPNKANVIGDFTKFNSNGFAKEVALVWGTVAINDQSAAEALAQLWVNTSTSAPGTPVTIFGYLIETSGGLLILAERFATPYVLSRNNQQLAIVPRFVLN